MKYNNLFISLRDTVYNGILEIWLWNKPLSKLHKLKKTQQKQKNNNISSEQTAV